MIRRPWRVSRLSSAGSDPAADRRGRSVTITDLKKIVPPTALIRR
jgi:hypothetical protein